MKQAVLLIIMLFPLFLTADDGLAGAVPGQSRLAGPAQGRYGRGRDHGRRGSRWLLRRSVRRESDRRVAHARVRLQ